MVNIAVHTRSEGHPGAFTSQVQSSMKKLLLSSGLLLAAGCTIGQTNNDSVLVQVMSPASIFGAYANAYAVPASGWGVPDITLPINAVEDTLRLGRDGTDADTLACETFVNPGEVAGKIAVVYRGVCNFGLKALNAQVAGARAVIIINNADDVAINMQGGDFGPDVTIPVVLISQSSGSTIRTVMDAEDVVAFIGNPIGQFPYNLRIGVEDVLIPSAASVPSLIASGPAEYQVQLGAFLNNIGTEAQSTIRLRAVVTQGATELYNEISSDQFMDPGDTIFVELPQFTQPTYSGSYSFTYTIESDEQDAVVFDNIFTTSLTFNNVMSYCPVDDATGLPKSNLSVVPAEFAQEFRTCIQFSDTNASRLVGTGLYFTARTPTDEVAPNDSVLTDLVATVQAYRWNDIIETAFTRPSTTGLETLTFGSYTFPSDQQNTPVFIPFDDPILFQDNQRYLFCVGTTDLFVRHGWNEDLDYTGNAQFFAEPVGLNQSDGEWFNGFTGLSGTPALGLQTIDATTIGIQENDKVDITPYPNPTNDRLNIPMKGFSGAAYLQLFDMNGAKVSEQKVAVGGNSLMTVDLTGVSAGTYMFHLVFENGKRSDFRVVVAK